MFGWRKACVEFSKRVSRDLPFFYHTSANRRFFEGDRPDFSKPQLKPRVQRANYVLDDVTNGPWNCENVKQLKTTSLSE